MKQKTNTKISESDHEIPGLGTIELSYTHEGNNHEFIVKSESMMSQISYSGDKARHYASKLLMYNSDTNEKSILQIKQIACECCNANLTDLSSPKRNDELVFARNLVIWYAISKLKFTEPHASAIVGRTKSLAYRVVRIFHEIEYFTNIQLSWYNKFNEKIQK